MVAAERAYTSEYTYNAPSNYAAEFASRIPERRTYTPEEKNVREKVRGNNSIETVPSAEAKSIITRAALFRAVLLMTIVGVLLIGTVWMSARATEIKYSINRINKENLQIENEIDMLNIKIESGNGIEAVEEYATKKLKMTYPKAEQCIYIDSDAQVSEDLVKIIKEKAYE